MLWKLIKLILGITSQPGLHGSAKWMGWFDKWKLLKRQNMGLILDGKMASLSQQKSFTHLAIIAPTGAGKTTKYVIPNLLQDRVSSYVVTDPSGEIHSKVSGYLLSQGYQVKVLDVTNVQNSYRYNPLHRCSSHSDIQKLSSLLIDIAYEDSNGDVFWSESSKNLISILIKIILQLPPERRNLGELWRLLNLFGFRQSEIDELASTHLDEMSFLQYGSFVSQSEKTMSNIVASAKSAVTLFSNPEVAELVSSETLHFESLRTQKTAIFLIVPENEIRQYKFLISTFYTQLLNYCMVMPGHNSTYLPIYFFLDEFGNIGKLPNFSTLITTLRKRQVSLSLIFQDVEQLSHVYGKADASVILNGGCATRLVYPGVSFAMCQEISNILGNRTAHFRESGFESESSASSRAAQMGRALLTPDEIRTMKSNRAIAIHGSELPILLKTVPYFKNWRLRRKTGGQ